MKRLLTALLLTTILSLGLISCGEEETEETIDMQALDHIVFNGSNHVQEIIDLIARDYKDVIIETYGPASSKGIAALLQGDADVAMSSRPIKEEEMAEGVELGIVEIPVAVDAILVYVNAANTAIEGLTMEQLKAIYTSEITNWSELGGEDLKISPYSCDPAISGSAVVFADRVMDGAEYGETVLYKDGPDALFTAMDTAPGGIYYFGSGMQYHLHTPIALNGLHATPESVRSGEYPMIRTLYIYYKEDIRPEAKAVLDYLLSKEGQEYVTNAGYYLVTD